MTKFSLKLEEQTWINLSAEELDTKMAALREIGIKKYFIVESESQEKTKTFAEKETEARKAFSKRLTDVKKRIDSEYKQELESAWKDYLQAKDDAIKEIEKA